MSHLTLALLLFLAGCSKRADVPPDAAPPAPSPSRAQARTAATAPDAAPDSKATWLCRGIYAEEQTLAATGAIVTVRGRVGKDPAYPLLENCDVVK